LTVATLLYEESDVTFKATAAVVGSRFVAPSGNRSGGGVETGLTTDLANVYRMAHCGAGVKAFGVAKYDVANAGIGGAYGQPGRIVPVTAGGAVTAGQEVMSDASGKAITHVPGTATNRACGLALTTAATDELVEVKLY
jgi:hypothetical protein